MTSDEFQSNLIPSVESSAESSVESESDKNNDNNKKGSDVKPKLQQS